MSSTAFVSTLPSPTLSTRATTTTTPISPFLPTLSHIPHARAHAHAATNTPLSTPPSAAAPASRILYWFTSDLRVHDNSPLSTAISACTHPSSTLLPVITTAPTPASRELHARLQSLGSSLIALSGPAEHVLPEACARLKLTAVHFSRSLDPVIAREQLRVTKALTSAGVDVVATWPVCIVAREDDINRTAFCMRELRNITKRKGIVADVTRVHAVPDRMPNVPTAVAALPQLRVDPLMGGGTSLALKLLCNMRRADEICAGREARFMMTIKALLDCGAVSTRMIAARVVQVVGALRGRSFEDLLWRDYVCVMVQRAVQKGTVGNKGRLVCA